MQTFENVEAIVFDMGNVIIDLAPERTENAFNALGAKSFASVFQVNRQSHFFTQYETGKISDADFRAQMQEQLQFSVSDAEFDQAFTAMLIDINPAKLDYIQRLREQYPVFLFSNTNNIHMSTYLARLAAKLQITSFKPYFDEIYFSYQMGTRKPEATGFLQIIQEQKLNAANTLFIDDVVENVEGAQKAGLLGHHFIPRSPFNNLTLPINVMALQES